MNARDTNKFVTGFFKTLREVAPDFYAAIQPDAENIMQCAKDRTKMNRKTSRKSDGKDKSV